VTPSKRAGGTVEPAAEAVTTVADEAGASTNGAAANGPSGNGPSANGNGSGRSRLAAKPRRRTKLGAAVPAPERGSTSARGSSSSLISKPPPTPPSSDGPSGPVPEESEHRSEPPATLPTPAAPAEARTTEPAESTPLPAIVPATPANRGAEVPGYPTATVLPSTLPVEPPPSTGTMTTHRVAPVPRVVGRRPRVRKVTRVVRHVDPWSVFKIAVVFNFVLYGIALTSGVLLWNVAYATGTIDNLERFFESFGWSDFEFNGGEIFHSAWIAGLFAVVGLTGAAVLGATLFNLITDLVGGVRLTVLEEEVVERTSSPMRRFVVRRPAGGSSTLDQTTPPPTNLPARASRYVEPSRDGDAG
jgi:transmembrane protein DUF3566